MDRGDLAIVTCRAIVACRLCDEHGHALSLEDGKPFTLHGEDCEKEYWPTCTHSLDGNKRELCRLEFENALLPTWTGYGEEIDGPAGEEIDGPDYDYGDEINAEMTGAACAASRLNDQRVRQQ